MKTTILIIIFITRVFCGYMRGRIAGEEAAIRKGVRFIFPAAFKVGGQWIIQEAHNKGILKGSEEIELHKRFFEKCAELDAQIRKEIKI